MIFGIVLLGDYMNHKKAGFSLLETILYLGIFSMFISVVVVFMINVLTTSARYSAQSEVNDTLFFVYKKMNYDLKNATNVTIVNPSEILITSNIVGREELKYILEDGAIKFGIKNASGCNYTNLCMLSSNLLEIIGFIVTKSTNVAGTETLIKYSIDAKYKPNNAYSKFEYRNAIEHLVVIKSI